MANDTTIDERGLVVPDDEADQPRTAVYKPEGMTTGQKVGVAAGITTATGLAAFGIYKLGERLGWWGTTIVINDDDLPTDDSSGGKSDSGTNPDGSRTRATGNPPNMSKDPKGYNTELFPGPEPVRLALLAVGGYKVDFSDQQLGGDDDSHPEVERFQADYNKVIRGIDKGRVKLPTDGKEPKKLDYLRGILVVDGIPGKNTLKALEIVFVNYSQNGLHWRTVVKDA